MADSSDFSEHLKIYYKTLFPFNTFHNWLAYDKEDKDYFSHREFSFTLPGDIYIRFQSFENEDEFNQELIKKCPIKIDIGAVYSSRPRDKMTSFSFEPEEKELVFDIDMTDYDDVRTCCQGAAICPKCWPLMTIAIKVIDRSLREEFGFEHLLWVYSGRRGVHCWVCDENVRKLDGTERSAIADYLTVVKGGDFQKKKVFLNGSMHPLIHESYQIVTSQVEDFIVNKQEIFANENYQKVLDLCPENHREILKTRFKNESNHKKRWEVLKEVNSLVADKNFKKTMYLYEEIILQFCYPRLDSNVTKGLNHLLKSPFCVHPGTGRVCVPIDLKNLSKFDPFSVPTLEQLNNELNELLKNPEEKADDKLYQKTSLGSSINYFKKFVKNIHFKTLAARNKAKGNDNPLDY